MRIAKSKGVADIGHLEEQLKESRKELAMVRQAVREPNYRKRMSC